MTRHKLLAAGLMCGALVGCSQWGDTQRSQSALSEFDCPATTTEVRFNVKAGVGEYSGTTSLVGGTSVGTWTHPNGTSGKTASAISNILFCDPSYTGTMNGRGKVPAGCVKIEGGQIGKSETITVGGVTVVVTSWGSKDGEPNEFISFSFVVCGTGGGTGGDPGGGTGSDAGSGSGDPGGGTGSDAGSGSGDPGGPGSDAGSGSGDPGGGEVADAGAVIN